VRNLSRALFLGYLWTAAAAATAAAVDDNEDRRLFATEV